MTAPHDTHDLSELMRRLSSHLDVLGGRLCAFEAEVGKDLSAIAAKTPQTITHFQSLDYLRQALADVCLLTACLGKVEGLGTLPASTAGDIDAALALQDTRALLRIHADRAQGPASGVDAGHVDLF